MPLFLVIGVAVAALVYFATRQPPMDFAPDASDGAIALDMDIETTGDFGYPWKPSPNKSSRNGAKVTGIVWHYTAGPTAASAIAWLCNPDAKASAHFVIDRDGTITQLVSCADAAWHAGVSSVNRATIGVELANVGWVESDGDGGWVDSQGRPWKADAEPVPAELRFPNGLTVAKLWVPYTPQQIAAIKALQKRIAGSAWSAALRDQKGHEDVLDPPGAKVDPGPLFPWDELVAFDDRPNKRTTVV